ncbi:hypothetical protein [Salibacterium lacus]|uniref:Uncharacterized protein n=1 Tax=Salibacterium lacus TaxID=1898109 RepID=A0ABW5SXA5_9BACI
MKRYFYITPEDYETAASNGIKTATLHTRVHLNGWDIDRAVTQPVRRKRSHGDWPKIAEANGISKHRYYTRVYHGYAPERAATMPPLTLEERVDKMTRDRRRFTDEQIRRAREHGVSRRLLQQRVVKQHWDVERAITEPVNMRREKV